jgi:O-antigen/teichoic acid export membrane protein
VVGLGRQAIILTVARLANYALMFVTPIFLVRLLSIEQFGQYREFMVYGSMLQWMAAFSINDSLLYFVPLHPASAWRIVKQSTTLTACSSLLVLGVVAVLDLSLGGVLLGKYLLPVILYVLFLVNVDFWESFFLASHRPAAMLTYSASRLGLRMLTVISAALVTRNVATIIWALTLFEGVRLAGSAVAWRVCDRSKSEPPLHDAWRAQLRFCVPTGVTVLLIMANRNLSNLAVAKTLGAVALALYTVGTYVEPILSAVSNSISTVLLPAMVRRNAQTIDDPLLLWKRACIVNCLILFPTVVLLARYADAIITIAFGAKYLAAVPVFQIFLLFIVRNCFDFAPPLRAINNTRPLLVCNILALFVSGIGLAVLMPLAGISGAVGAFVLSSLVEPVYLSRCVMRRYRVSLQQLLPWRSIGAIAACALLAVTVILSSAWTSLFGRVGVLMASIAYAATFVILLRMTKVSEAMELLSRIGKFIARNGSIRSLRLPR